MALTAAEQAELAQLRKEVGKAPAPSPGLTPQEQAEMEQLKKEVGSQPEERPWYSITPRGLLQGTLNALPTAGAILGGATSGFIGAPAGAAAGENTKMILEEKLLGKERPTREEYYGNLGKSALDGVSQEMMGGIVGKVGESFAGSGVKEIGKSFNRPGAKEITTAATNLNVKPTQGMLTDDYVARNLENSLSQSPSIPGSLVRREQDPIRNVIRETSEDALKGASSRSNMDAGREIKQGVANRFQKEYDPIAKAYDEIEAQTSNIPIDKKGLQRVSKNIRSIDEARFSGSEGHSIANQFAGWLDEAKSVNDIKILRSKALNIMRDPNTSFEAKQAAAAVTERLERVQRNTIMRQAVEKARQTPQFPPEGKQWPSKQAAQDANAIAEVEGEIGGKELVGKIKGTNKQYRGLMEDVQKFGEGTGLTKGKSVGSAIEDVKGANPQNVPEAMFDPGNIEFTRYIAKRHPEQYQIAREQKLQEIAQKSQAPDGQLDPKKLRKIIDKLEPEARTMLFGDDVMKRLDDVNTLMKATPSKVGASDTPRGFDFREILSPTQNIVDAGRYGLLKIKTSPKLKSFGNSVQGYRRPIGGLLYDTPGLINRGLMDE